MVFEGSEKKLEIVLDLKDLKTESLREIPRSFWVSLVAASNAQILSEVSSANCDSYLLSESSLFVFENRILMITCGQTQLINAAKLFIEKFGTSRLKNVFYERKNEAFPEAQSTSFEDDCSILGKYIQGQSYSIGVDGHPGHIRIFHWGKQSLDLDQGRTYEFLMHDLDPRVIRNLRDSNRLNRTRWSNALHFDSIFPNYFIDEHWFEPCGYSMNGINGDRYFTIHITPEEQASYVSLETNHPFSEETLKIAARKILGLFRPEWTLLVQFQSNPTNLSTVDFPEIDLTPSESVRLDLEPSAHMQFQVIRYTPDIMVPIQPQTRKKQSVWISR